MVPDSPATNHVWLDQVPHSPAVEIKQVPMITLDQYCEYHDIEKIDFLKIDTEGLEPFVLAGARQCLANGKIPFLLLELCPELLIRAGTSVAELYHALTSNGYEPRQLNANGEPGFVLSLDELTKIEWADIVAVPC